jgi:hypothetical protein
MSGVETPDSRLREPIEYLVEGWRLFMDNFASIVGVLAPLIPVTLVARIYHSDSVRYLYAEMGVTVLVQSLLLVAFIGMLPRMYEGESVSVRRAWHWGFQYWGVYLLNWIKVAVLIFVGLFLFIIPGVYLAISFCLFGFVVVLEQHPTPLQRCLQLVHGYRMRLLFLVALFVLYPLFEGFLNVLLRQTGSSWLLTPFAIVDIMMLGYMTTVFYLVYLDLSAGDFEEDQSIETPGHTGAVFPLEDDSVEIDEPEEPDMQEPEKE